MEGPPSLKSETAFMCYTFLENNEKFMIPIISNRYFVNIKNNFAEIKSSQVYKNPFTKPLEIHYSIPTDPDFCITRVVAIYDNLTVEGAIKEREKAKAEFKEAKSKGETVMMASTEAFEKSILRVRLGNLLGGESVKIEFDMVGRLQSEVPNSWTLRIPSHVGPRYQTQMDTINLLFKKLLKSKPEETTTFVPTNTEWDFKINLFSTKKILKAGSCSHKLAENVFSESFRSYNLN